MTHPDELIRRYLDGELAPDLEAELNTHLAACGRCRDQLAALERLDLRLRDLGQLAAPRDFATRLRAQIATLPPPRRATIWIGPLALALALVGVFGILLASDQFYALSSSLLAALSDLPNWLLDLLGGDTSLNGAGPNVPAGIGPVLVVGLCLIGLAGLLILLQSLESQIDV